MKCTHRWTMDTTAVCSRCDIDYTTFLHLPVVKALKRIAAGGMDAASCKETAKAALAEFEAAKRKPAP